MIELRWLKKTSVLDGGWVSTEKVLQYRERYFSIDIVTMEPIFLGWSDWRDVTEVEDDQPEPPK